MEVMDHKYAYIHTSLKKLHYQTNGLPNLSHTLHFTAAFCICHTIYPLTLNLQEKSDCVCPPDCTQHHPPKHNNRLNLSLPDFLHHLWVQHCSGKYIFFNLAKPSLIIDNKKYSMCFRFCSHIFLLLRFLKIKSTKEYKVGLNSELI